MFIVLFISCIGFVLLFSVNACMFLPAGEFNHPHNFRDFQEARRV